MLTIDKLKEFGANTEEGLTRCMNMTEFYLKMVGKAMDGAHLEELEAAVNAKDLTRAFELAHAQKGVFANLSLTPLLGPVSEMTELLRAGTDTDYTPYLTEAKAQLEKLRALMD